jgi:hypothetical protein
MIKRRIPKKHIEVDLSGPEGNAFYLLGLADKLAKRFDLDTKIIHKEMMAGDYENLIQVFDRYFGTMVILYR